jgi:hypothetical protein
MRSHNDSIDTTYTPPPLSFYNTFKSANRKSANSWAQSAIAKPQISEVCESARMRENEIYILKNALP